MEGGRRACATGIANTGAVSIAGRRISLTEEPHREGVNRGVKEGGMAWLMR
jgi:hypothetical protein